MNKVYILQEVILEEVTILGVYTTLENAQQAFPDIVWGYNSDNGWERWLAIVGDYHNLIIEEYVVDVKWR